MAYTDVITLAQARTYLRIDDDNTDDDASITRMINASLRYIENYTDVLVYARDKEYLVKRGVLKLYQFPLNTDLDTLTGYTYERKSKYINICANNTNTVDLELNVGYANASDVPNDLIEVALEMIDLYYYGEKDGKPIEKTLSPMSMATLDAYKRFWI